MNPRSNAVAARKKPRRRGRPPQGEARLAHARDQLLREGIAMLTERGFNAAGLDEILNAVGVPKGSFYHYFDSKADFGLALIDAYAAYFATKLDRWFLDESLSPLARMRAFVEDARAGMARFDFRRGCLVGNLGQEIGVLPDAFRDRLAIVFADWEARTERCLAAAQAAGEISADADCASLAGFFWIGWEGAVLRAKLEHDPAALDRFADGFFYMCANKTIQKKLPLP